jgi:hypothetical protein
MARRVSPGVRSAQFSFLLGAAGRGLSANKALTALRQAGMGIGRTLGLKLYRTAKAIVEQRPAAAGLDWNNPIPDDFARDWPSARRGGYGVTVRINAVNHVTGNEIDVYHTTYTNTLITPAEAVSNAIDKYSEPKYADEFTMEYGVVSNVVKYTPDEA